MKRIPPTLLILLLVAGAAFAQEAPQPPASIEVADEPNDFGGAILVRWELSPTEGVTAYWIYRASAVEGPWELIHKAAADEEIFVDKTAPEGESFYRVTAYADAGGESAAVTAEAPSAPIANWFNDAKYKSVIIVFLFTALILGWIWTAGQKLPGGAIILFFAYALIYCIFIFLDGKRGILSFAPMLLPALALAIPILKRGGEIFIRPIPAIQAVEEAIGWATEMGKPILFVPGISTIQDVATIAALNILSPVAEKAAQYDSKLIVPNFDPIVFTITQEVVKEAYLKAGRPDAYRDEDVFYLSARQFAYAAAVNGIMMREKPATNFFLGMFFAESLLLAETGNMTGAIQIAGTDAVTQLPFFIVACDYTLIGEELYAAGAYMGDDPKLTGSLKGQDWSKAICIFFLIGFTLLYIIWGAIKNPDDWSEDWKKLPKTLFEVRR